MNLSSTATTILIVLAAIAAFIILFLWTLPITVRWLCRLALAPGYELEILGRDKVPRKGPCVLVANHISFLDGVILAAVSPRPGKVLVAANYVSAPVLRQLARRAGIVAVPWKGPKAQRAVIDRAREALSYRELLALFPEATISRTGFPNKLYRGIELILHGRDGVPIIPVAIDGMWGSRFSFSGGHFFGDKPRSKGRRRVVVLFGDPIYAPVTLFQIRQAMIANSARAFEFRRPEDRDKLPETIDRSLGYWEHPELGLLTASAPHVDTYKLHQDGWKEGSAGRPVPGVAIKAVDAQGTDLGPGEEGHLLALLAGRPDWIDTGRRGSVDIEGFVNLS